MGQEVVRALAAAEGMQLVLAVDTRRVGEDAGEVAGIQPLGVPIRQTLVETLEATQPQVLVDFTVAEAALRHAEIALEQGVHTVIGTSGLDLEAIRRLGEVAEQRGTALLVVPNFSIGAVLMMHFAQEAARFFTQAEIIELHHEGKLDAPSGTAIRTAELIASAHPATKGEARQERVQYEGARGAQVEAVRVHSVRLPGLLAHQEVIFGGTGEVLTIRHDSTSRQSFMPGVLLAIRKVQALKGLVVGLDKILFESKWNG